MKTGDINHHKPMLTVLKKAGFKVVETEKHGKKIVITVTRMSSLKLEKTGVTREKQKIYREV